MGSVAGTFAILREDQKALALVDEIQRSHPNDTIAINATIPIVRAIAALRPANPAKADPAKAIDFLNTAALYARADAGVFYVRGLADSSRLDVMPKRSRIFSGSWISNPNSGPDVIFAVVQLDLGRLFQKQGDLPKARIAYQSFSADL